MTEEKVIWGKATEAVWDRENFAINPAYRILDPESLALVQARVPKQ